MDSFSRFCHNRPDANCRGQDCETCASVAHEAVAAFVAEVERMENEIRLKPVGWISAMSFIKEVAREWAGNDKPCSRCKGTMGHNQVELGFKKCVECGRPIGAGKDAA